jgi:hypothetical protein
MHAKEWLTCCIVDQTGCWGSRSSEASPSSAHAENLRCAHGFGLAGRPFATGALTKH